MKPDYKNWVPKEIVVGLAAGTFISSILLVVFGMWGIGLQGTVRSVLTVISGIASIAFLAAFGTMLNMHVAFSYTGKHQLARRIVWGISEYAKIPDGGVGLDIGCGSGALTIYTAKKNPNAKMIGIDVWDNRYKEYSKTLCEQNAEAEGIKNVEFAKGNAIKLDYPDESFDYVTSNYCYHNITGKNKQELLLETLRVLKKGGTFAIHDLMSVVRYGDMKSFKKKLLDMGYEEVELIDTAHGLFMSSKEAKNVALRGSTLLVGKK